MKKLILLAGVLFGFLSQIHASHLMGGQITYVAQDSLNYKVFVAVYRDCTGNSMASNPALVVHYGTSDTSIYGSMYSVKDVTDIVSGCYVKSKCGTSSGFSAYGIQEYIYVYDLSLTGISHCKIALSWQECCRINTLTTGGSNTPFYIETSLNKCIAGGNSSLFYEDHVQMVLRYNHQKTISFAGQDSTHGMDSVHYSLTSPLRGQDSVMAYTSNYSYDKPFNFQFFPNAGYSYPYGFNFYSNIGLMGFTPVQNNQVFTTSIKAEVFKRIGDSMVWVSTIHKNYTGIVAYAGGNSMFWYNPFDHANEFPKVCAGDTLELTNRITSVPGNFYAHDSWLSIPHDTVLTTGIRIHNLYYYPDSSHVQYGPHFHNLYYSDSGCQVVSNWQSLTRAFYVVPEIKETHHPLISITKNCNSVSMQVRDTNDLGIEKFTWRYNGVEQTGDSVFFLVADTGWKYFSINLDNGGACNRTFMDSFYMDSVSYQRPIFTYSTIETCVSDTAFLSLSSSTGIRSWYLDNIDSGSQLAFNSDTLIPIKNQYVSISYDSQYCYFSDTMVFRSRNTPYLVPHPARANCIGNLADITLESTIDSAAGIAPFSFYWNGQPAASLDTTFHTTGSIRIGRTIIDSLGCSYTDSVSIVENNPFYIYAGADSSVCEGAEFKMKPYFSPAASMIRSEWVGVDSGAYIPIKAVKSAYFVFEMERYEGCTLRDSFFLTVGNFTSVSILSDSIICPGDSLLNSFTTTGQYPVTQTWTFMGDTAYSNGIMLGHTAGTYTAQLSIVLVDTNHCIARDSQLIYTREPQAQIVLDSSFVCKNQTMVLHVDSFTNLQPTGYSWVVQGYFASSADSLVYSNSLAGQMDTVALVLNDDFGCNTRLTQVMNTSGFRSTIDAYPLVCGGDSLLVKARHFNAKNQVMLDWEIGNKQYNDSSFFYVPVPGQSYQIKLVTTDGDGCEASDSFDFSTTNFMVSIVSDSVLCLGEEHTFEAVPRLGPEPINYIWKLNNQTSGTSLLAVSNASLASGVYTISLEAVDSNGCHASNSSQVRINKFGKPKITDQHLCFGDSLLIDALDTGALGLVSYTWTNGISSSNDSVLNYLADAVVNQNWYYQAIDDSWCLTQDSFLIEVRKLRDDILGDRIACGQDSLMFSHLPRYGYTPYSSTWTKNAALVSYQDNIVLRGIRGDVFELSLLLKDSMGCELLVSDSIYFNNETQIVFLHDSIYCSSSPAILLDTVVSPQGGTFTNQAGIPIQYFDPSRQASGNHLLIYRGGDFGCEKIDTSTLYVHPQPTAQFYSSGRVGLNPFQVQFFGTIQAQNPTIKWDFGDGSFTLDSIAPSHIYVVDSLYDVTLTVVDSGCQVVESKQGYIFVNGNTIGLNGPGVNALSAYPNPFKTSVTIQSEVPMVQVKIFDMKGALIETREVEHQMELVLNLSKLAASEVILYVTTEVGFEVIKVQRK